MNQYGSHYQYCRKAISGSSKATASAQALADGLSARYQTTMLSLRSAATPTGGIWATLLTLALALRLLTPAGFMPAFDHGAVSIVACPDWDGGTPATPTHHHHGGSKTTHQPCSFAAGSGLGALTGALGPLLDVWILAPALLLGRIFLFLERRSARERPPTRAPPFAA
jgi:hypothetical protein